MMIKESSAGIIPFYEENGERLYLILLSNLAEKEFWELPNGHIEKGESAKTAAAREFEEETGISDWTLIPKFKKILRYFYRRKGQLVSKSVIYFLGEAKSKKVTISHESKDYAWVSLAEAPAKIKHNNIRRMLVQADEYLNEYQKNAKMG
jgi:8-oxo-dGTP pyrophosphatase MutT (NUDIX family)